MQIRTETAADHPAVRDVVGRAFGTHRTVDDMVEAIRASEHYVPEFAFVATVDDAVAGFVMLSYATLADGDVRHRVLTLSPLAVAPEHQRQGLGGALVRAAVTAADERREPLILLEGSPLYYSRFGFEHCVPHGLAIPLPDWAPSEAAQVYLLTGYDPAIRGMLEYPAAFDLAAEH